MSYLTNPYMVTSAEALPIYGTHGYQFGGKGGAGTTSEQITENELGTATASSEISTLSTPRQLGANAQTVTEIYTMGGQLSNPPHTTQTDIEEYTVGSATQSAHKSDLETGVTYVFNHGYNETYAYVMGGTTGAAIKTDIQQYEMGTGSAVTSPADLQTGVRSNAGGTNPTYCYSYVGNDGSYATYIQTYQMEIDTTASITGASAPARSDMAASAQSTTHIVGFGGAS